LEILTTNNLLIFLKKNIYLLFEITIFKLNNYKFIIILFKDKKFFMSNFNTVRNGFVILLIELLNFF
jgi:hypothetical protein